MGEMTIDRKADPKVVAVQYTVDDFPFENVESLGETEHERLFFDKNKEIIMRGPKSDPLIRKIFLMGQAAHFVSMSAKGLMGRLFSTPDYALTSVLCLFAKNVKDMGETDIDQDFLAKFYFSGMLEAIDAQEVFNLAVIPPSQEIH